MRMLLTAFAAGMVMPATAQAEIIDFTISGKVTGHQMPNGDPGYESNPIALQAFLANYALGTEYRFTFSYDTAVKPTNAFGRYATYADLPIGGTFFLGDASAALPTAHVVIGEDFVARRERIAFFGNSVLPRSRQFSGFSTLDFSFEATSINSIGPDLPNDLTLASNPFNNARVRFFRADVGETGVLFSIDRLNRSAPAVPEPSTWAMMILGFGVASIALRSRNITLTA